MLRTHGIKNAIHQYLFHWPLLSRCAVSIFILSFKGPLSAVIDITEYVPLLRNEGLITIVLFTLYLLMNMSIIRYQKLYEPLQNV
jgi:hypothetical protein